ncbi:hypothetical protein [Anaerophilus nitritogenes]|uniref:hypothetical protein n=1 Tax=Anaerophilus nitritogenes TaxID=2498136 RepID=UPI00101BD1D7|nr:hypothetical protein [Anaerophilus nitritogenes]
MEEKMFEMLSKIYGEMQEGFSQTNKRLDNIENTITKLETKMDGEINNKIEALFDGYKNNTEILHRLEMKLDDLSNKLEKQEVDIRVLKAAK